jgi:hypothetical protein
MSDIRSLLMGFVVALCTVTAVAPQPASRFDVPLGWISILTASEGHTQAPSAKADPAVDATVMQVMKDYLDAWNRLDVVALERTLHFPHYRLASGRMTDARTTWSTDGGTIPTCARAGVGSHPMRLRIIHSSPDKVHVDTLFTRYRKNGSIINSFESLYVVTKEQGRWGVKLRSSMAP